MRLTFATNCFLAFSVAGVAVVTAEDDVLTLDPTFFVTDDPTAAPTTQIEALDFDCVGCIESGYVFCPLDAKCWADTEEPFGDELFPVLPFSCQSADDMLEGDSATCSPPGNFFSDPLYSTNEWVFEMINVRPVWEKGYFGESVNIRVNDDGFQIDHVEFAGRIDIEASCDDLLPEPDMTYSHGTAATSVAAASGDNGECSVGIAPKSGLSFCKFTITAAKELMVYNLDTFDIHTNSYGPTTCNDQNNDELFERGLQEECPFQVREDGVPNPCDVCEFPLVDPVPQECATIINEHCLNFFQSLLKLEEKACLEHLDYVLGGQCYYNSPNVEVANALAVGITQGRNGKGVIYLFASGNEFTEGEDTHQQGAFTNTRFTLTIGAVDQTGKHAPYSTQGSAVFLSAPGGSVIQNEIQQAGANMGSADNCRDAGQGTSFACPVAAGVVALMLDANPDLTWRDVQAILASTAQPVDDENDETIQVNTAGFYHSNRYGFGIVDAAAAVEAAETWTNLLPESMFISESGDVNLVIPDDSSSPVSTSLMIDGAKLTVETVYVYLSLEHSSRGQLEITLTSPGGTKSRLLQGIHPESGQSEIWKFISVKHWGEESDGDWSLTIVDRKAGVVSACVDTDADWAIPCEEVSPDCKVSCKLLETNGICRNGEPDLALLDESGSLSLLDTPFGTTNETMTEACCACGGGISADELSETLFKWDLVIYGRDVDGSAVEPTVSPSATQSATPTVNSTTATTDAPTEDTTVSPTLAPVEESTEGPIAAPTDVTEAPAGVLTTPPVSGDCLSIAELACSSDYLSTLCAAVVLAGLNETLSTGTWTVFAPINDGFLELLSSGQLGNVISVTSPMESLKDLLLFHVASGVYSVSDLTCSGLVQMANGRYTRTRCQDDTPTQQKGAGNTEDNTPTFVTMDIAACNGVVHVIDKVLLA